VTDGGDLCRDFLNTHLDERTKILALTHVSNVTGTVNPLEEVLRRARACGALTIVDATQSAPHGPLRVDELGCDFLVFSGHKVYGPTGIGVLYGRERLLEELPPYQGGGGMVMDATMQGATFEALPHKFEAGTPHVAGAVGLGSALDFLCGLDPDALRRHEGDLLARTLDLLRDTAGVRLLGDPARRASLCSFVTPGVHASDVARLLDQAGVAVRAGNLCAAPLMQRFGTDAAVRVSLGCHSSVEDVEAFASALRSALELLGGA
jgi:cysteine desulfurase/selenocysteine lyase